MNKGISRRDFLKSTAASALGVAAMGLLSACSTNEMQPESTSVVTANSGSAAADGRVPGYCGPGDWLGEKPVVADSEIKEEKTFDVVILGGGHSGLGAALGTVIRILSAASCRIPVRCLIDIRKFIICMKNSGKRMTVMSS